MAAHRKLGPIEVEQIVAARGAGRSLREIAAALGVSHSTVSRRLGSDPLLRLRIRSAQKREARRARDRERKRQAKARREAGLEVGPAPEPEWTSPAAPSTGSERELLEQAPEDALTYPPRGVVAIAQPDFIPEPRKRGGRPTPRRRRDSQNVEPDGARLEAARVSSRPHGRRDELRLARRIVLDRSASFEARELALEKLVELLGATRSNGRPAYSLRLEAAKAIMQNPARTDAYASPTRSSARRGLNDEDEVLLRRLRGR